MFGSKLVDCLGRLWRSGLVGEGVALEVGLWSFKSPSQAQPPYLPPVDQDVSSQRLLQSQVCLLPLLLP